MRGFVTATIVVAWLSPLAAQDGRPSVLARARAAAGGEARLASVQSLSVKGSARITHQKIVFYGPDRPRMVVDASSDFEIQIVLPDRFLITRKGPAGSWHAHGLNGTRVINRVRPVPGAMVSRRMWAGPDVADQMTSAARREFLRYVVVWLLTAPEPDGVQFREGGVTAIDGREMGIVDAAGPDDFAVRLHFDKQARLALATYRERPDRSDGPERRLRFEDHRAADGILFPHRLTFEYDGQVVEWKIKRFTVNPSLDPALFSPR